MANLMVLLAISDQTLTWVVLGLIGFMILSSIISFFAEAPAFIKFCMIMVVIIIVVSLIWGKEAGAKVGTAGAVVALVVFGKWMF